MKGKLEKASWDLKKNSLPKFVKEAGCQNMVNGRQVGSETNIVLQNSLKHQKVYIFPVDKKCSINQFS